MRAYFMRVAPVGLVAFFGFGFGFGFGAVACSPPPEPAVAPVTTSSAVAPPLPPVEKHVSPLEEVLEGIRVVTPTERIATKHAVDVFLSHKTLLLGTVNAEPVKKDGKTVAVRLYGISPNTIPSAVGFENGDQLVSLNGKPLFGDDDMSSMLGRLDAAFRSNEIEFDIVRKGAPVTLKVHVDTGPSPAP